MVAGMRRILLPVGVVLVLLLHVRPTASEVPALLRPITAAGRAVTSTTSAVVKSSASALKTVGTTTKKMIPKIGWRSTPPKPH